MSGLDGLMCHFAHLLDICLCKGCARDRVMSFMYKTKHHQSCPIQGHIQTFLMH
uniref:Uncharacterized protein n=1 Tax=Arion vulgaris TaxID=1028688 RepID=A0A0B7APY7_9EUPU